MMLKSPIRGFTFFLFLSYGTALTPLFASNDETKPDAVIKEEGMNIYIKPSLFSFFLLHPALNGKLANELHAGDIKVSKNDGKLTFSTLFFVVEMEKIEIKNKKYELTFNYKIGIDEPLPLFAGGRGVADIFFKEEEKNSLKADMIISLTAGGGLLGGVTKSFPKILEVIFSVKMEKAIRDAEKFAEFFNGSAGEILDVVTDKNSDFTRRELRELKKFFRRQNRR